MVEDGNVLSWTAREQESKDKLGEPMQAKHAPKLYVLLAIPTMPMYQEAVVTLMRISVMMNTGLQIRTADRRDQVFSREDFVMNFNTPPFFDQLFQSLVWIDHRE